MEKTTLANTSNEDLLKYYKRAIELQCGKSPYDSEQLSEEILNRMNKRIKAEREVGDDHDEFS